MRKRALRFTLCLLPVAAAAAYLTALYSLSGLDPALVDSAVARMGSRTAVLLAGTLQSIVYAVVCGFFGYILADKLGLMRPWRPERLPLLRTLAASAAAGAVFSLDRWTFCRWIPALWGADYGFDAVGWLASVLYGGVIEEVMLRLFVMSLVAWLAWKLFCRGRETVPEGVLIAANCVAALLFAAGHLPSTVQLLGGLTPLLVFRCFLLNGAFGLLFGRLYRKYGIQYAMLSHALVHIVSKSIWLLFP